MKRYITFKDYEEVFNIGKFWIDKCIDDQLEDGTIYHHLPLIDVTKDPLDEKNFNMDSKYRRDFHKHSKIIEKYIKEKSTI